MENATSLKEMKPGNVFIYGVNTILLVEKVEEAKYPNLKYYWNYFFVSRPKDANVYTYYGPGTHNGITKWITDIN